jgi:hypothetical protein
MTTRLPILSNSEEKCFRACQRKHHYSYRLLSRPISKPKPMRFGTLMHHGLEVWWKTAGDWMSAITYMRAKATAETDAYEMAAAEALMIGYHTRWSGEPYEPLGVELLFEAPIVHPVTGATSPHFVHGGKIDAIARHHPTNEVHLTEHKTASEDIEMGSQYWQRLRLDTQVSKYFVGARALGYDITKCLYDVMRRPAQEPKRATPPELRKYTQAVEARPAVEGKPAVLPRPASKGVKATKGRPATQGKPAVEAQPARLYANQREVDETPDEFFDRVASDIQQNPSYYFARGFVVRLENDLREWAYDVWKTAIRIKQGEDDGHYPRNPDACGLYHRSCEYLAVCVGDAQIDDPYLFRKAGAKHEELVEEA